MRGGVFMVSKLDRFLWSSLRGSVEMKTKKWWYEALRVQCVEMRGGCWEKCSEMYEVQWGTVKCRKRETDQDRLAHAGKISKHVELFIGWIQILSLTSHASVLHTLNLDKLISLFYFVNSQIEWINRVLNLSLSRIFLFSLIFTGYY